MMTGILIIISSPFAAGEKNQNGKASDFEIKINKMVGGGFAGATDLVLLNSSGEVYSIKAATYKDEPQKNLIKHFDKKKVDSLRAALIEADIWSISPGSPQYSGQQWEIVIDGRKKTLNFSKTPDRLKKTEKIINDILSPSTKG